MRRIAFFALPALALACTPDDGSIVVDDTATDTEADTDTDADSDTDTDTDADTDVGCDDELDYLDPGNGTIDVSPTPTLSAWLVDGNPDATIELSLSGPDGEVSGSVANANGGARWTFSPDEELARTTQYTFLAEVCGESLESTFTTVSGPVDASGLVGKTYDIGMDDDLVWNSPDQTVGALLLGYIDTDHVLVNIDAVDVDNDTITTIGAMGWDQGNGVEQYPCTYSIPFDAADFSGNPYFQAGPSNTTLGAGGFDVNVEDFTVSGSFTEDASAVSNMRIVGYMDVRDLEFQGVDACTALTFLGGGCEACPSDGVKGCVKLDVEDSEAPLTDVAFDKAIDPSQNPDCE